MMADITGLVGREELLARVMREIGKGKHVLLTGGVGLGKSVLLASALDRMHGQAVIRLKDHQAKAQFVEMAKQLLAMDMLTPKALELPEAYWSRSGSSITWDSIKRTVTRLSIRDLSHAVIPALAASGGRVCIAVDDMTWLTPTQQAFWLAVFDHAQVVGCCSDKKKGLRKLWWRMTDISVPPLHKQEATQVVQRYITQQGMLIESPELFIAHVVQQSGGVPQAIHDMLDTSSKERVLNKRQVREMCHAAGIRYLDFTPSLVLIGGVLIATRYVAMGIGDQMLYVMGGIGAAMFLSIRVTLLRR